MVDKNAIAVDLVLHQSEIAAMGRLRGACNDATVDIGGSFRSPGSIKFVRFISHDFDLVLRTYTGVGEFAKMPITETAKDDFIRDAGIGPDEYDDLSDGFNSDEPESETPCERKDFTLLSNAMLVAEDYK